MATREEMKQALSNNLKSARDICERADRENRNFTAEERAKVQKHLADARSLKEQLKQSDDPDGSKQRSEDEEMKNIIIELGKGFESPSKWKSGPWSKAFRDWCNRTGQKELLTPSGSVGVPALSGYVPSLGEKVETILQVIKITPLTSSSVEYLREVSRTQNAATVADSGVKPTSVYELEEIDSPARVIAHLSEPVPRRYLSDQANISRYLDTVLKQGLTLELENQIINGTGVAPDLDGMLNVAGVTVLTPDGVLDRFGLARRGITILELKSLPIDELVFAIHPSTWESFELSKETDGNYILQQDSKPSPINRQKRQLWGVPVAPVVSMPEETLLLFHRGAIELFEREQAKVDWSENTISLVEGTPVSDFSRNLIRFRAEGRWVLAIYKPDAIVEIDLEEGS